MVNNLTTFNFGENQVRTVMINGEPWFVAKDICTALEHSNTSKAIADHVHDDDKTNYSLALPGSAPTIVNESGLYALIFGSRLDKAKAFKKWVTSEVLPAIRKTGTYSVSQPAPTYSHKDFLPSPAMEAVQIGTMLADVLNLYGTSRTAMISDALKIKAPEYLSLMPAYATNAPRTKDGKLLGGEGNSLTAYASSSLLKKFGSSLSAVAFNKLAEAHGYLEIRERPSSKHENVAKTFKAISDKGLEFGYNLSNEFSKGSVNPVWFESTFQKLLDIIS